MKSIHKSLGDVRRRINDSAVEIISEERLPNSLETKFVTAHGHVVVAYDSGNAVIQGKNQEQMEKIMTR